ncbi:protein lethal(2)essential for life [Nomia melanderi]|uniref:protein lethal(2)essential for life n=1 Tax=Nomia melanderi TaxID=2448451 RepID=UPI00130400BB|nr:protein lethal(2)essential for life-like [Nomia melanderi]
MSLIPILFSDWWEDLDRPHRLWNQYFGTGIDPDDILLDGELSETLLYRPTPRRNNRRYHPFWRASARKGHGASTVKPDKNKFEVTLDVSQFVANEVNVKVVDQNVIVEAKHDEKEDEHGWVSRRFVRKYIVPSQCDIDRVESRLSNDGILSITVPRKEPLKPESSEKIIKIQYTGKPALTNCEEQVNGTPESQKEQTQRGQREQTHQRGKKRG